MTRGVKVGDLEFQQCRTSQKEKPILGFMVGGVGRGGTVEVGWGMGM